MSKVRNILGWINAITITCTVDIGKLIFLFNCSDLFSSIVTERQREDSVLYETSLCEEPFFIAVLQIELLNAQRCHHQVKQ